MWRQVTILETKRLLDPCLCVCVFVRVYVSMLLILEMAPWCGSTWQGDICRDGVWCGFERWERTATASVILFILLLLVCVCVLLINTLVLYTHTPLLL